LDFDLIHVLGERAAEYYEGKNEVCARIGYFNCGINLNTETPTAEKIRDAMEKVRTNTVYKTAVTNLSKALHAENSNEKCISYILELLDKKAAEPQVR